MTLDILGADLEDTFRNKEMGPGFKGRFTVGVDQPVKVFDRQSRAWWNRRLGPLGHRFASKVGCWHTDSVCQVEAGGLPFSGRVGVS